MINLETMAKKIDSILNGTDPEIPNGLVSIANDNFFFKVFSEGLYLSENYDSNSGKNFIPVIVGAYGGENNPVADLGEQDRNVLIQILFPVRFKTDMYDLEEYLDTVIVGKELTFGTQKAICNISPAQYGELQDFDFVEFSKWVENIYLQPIEKMETYMSMTLTLYISTAKKVGGDGFVYGNSYTTSVKVGTTLTNHSISGTYYEDKNPIFVGTGDTLSNSPASQQLLGDTFAKGLPITSGYGKQITLYVKNDSLYVFLVKRLHNRTFNDLIFELSEDTGLTEIVSDVVTPITFTHLYYVTDMILNINKGQLMTLTLTLADYLEI